MTNRSRDMAVFVMVGSKGPYLGSCWSQRPKLFTVTCHPEIPSSKIFTPVVRYRVPSFPFDLFLFTLPDTAQCTAQFPEFFVKEEAIFRSFTNAVCNCIISCFSNPIPSICDKIEESAQQQCPKLIKKTAASISKRKLHQPVVCTKPKNKVSKKL